MIRRLFLLGVIGLGLVSVAFAQGSRSVIVPANGQLVTEVGLFSVTETLNDAAFSPDSRFVATVGDDTALRVWDVATGKQISEAFEHFSFAKAILWMPDTIVTGSWDNTAIVWGVTDGVPTPQHVISGYDAVVDTLASDMTGDSIAIGVGDGAARIYDLQAQAVTADLSVESLQVSAVAYSPDGTFWVTAGGFPSTGAVMWDSATGAKIREIPYSATVMSLAFAPNGILAVGGDDGIVTLWQDGEQIASLDQTDWVADLAFNPTGDILAVARQDGILTLWDVTTPDAADLIVAIVASDSAALTSVAVSPDGRLIVTTDEEGFGRLWGISVK